MDARQRNTLNALERMQVFLTTNPLPAPLVNTSAGFTEQVTALGNAISDAQSHAVNQGSGQPYQVSRHRAYLRRKLQYQHLQPIRNIGHTLEKTVPGMPKLVNLRQRFRSEQSLIAVAKATMRDVLPHRTLFIARGLPSDFLAQLEFAIAALEQEKTNYAEAIAQRVAARTGINNALSAGLIARRCLTEVIKLNCSSDEENGPATLRAWESVSRIRRPDQPSITSDSTPEPESEPSDPLPELQPEAA